MTKNNCTITQITEEDITGFHAAVDYVAKEKKYLLFLQAPPLEETRTFVLRNIQADHAQFVARAGGKVVGWCDIIPAKAGSVSGHVGVLGIGVLPEFRHKGIGRRLMQTALEKAKKNGLTRIELGVREQNENALKLYKELGFEIEGLRKRAVKVDGVYENSYLMALLV